MRRGFISVLTLILALTASPWPTAQATLSGVAGSPLGYWHTAGNRIVDSNGQTIRIAAVNWFGMENTYFVPAGLEKQPLASIVAHVKALGFNAIRLPFSDQLVRNDPVVTKHLNANRNLRGLRALALMDRVVAAARHNGLRIILDDARSSAGTQPEYDGLWYARRYPERTWIHDWQLLVRRYNGDSTVVGVDIRNEPHTAPPGPWSLNTYLHHGATWGPYKGVEHKATDWRLAAERGGNAVLAINPHLLIFVEGLQLYPDKTQPRGVDSYWWGGILTPAGKYPVRFNVPHQLVYSPHEYGPMKWPMPFFGPHMTYARMARVWDRHWGYLEQGPPSQQTPILLGEFGTCGVSPRCVHDTKPGSQGLWFSFLMRYLTHHPEIGWSFWALNGTSHLGDNCPNYVLRQDWRTVRLPPLIRAFHAIEAPL